MRAISRPRADRAAARSQSPEPPEERSRRSGGPAQDRALYTCHCGFVFQASVSTSVGCPHCGGTQAW